MRASFLMVWNLSIGLFSYGQAPPGYYENAEGLEGEELREALHQIIDNHNVQSYSSLWTHFQTTDVKSNGKVWDMYSDVPDGIPAYEYSFGSDQCGNYAQEGDCYNREHSFPKSWFDDQSPMNTDLFHLYPTDGYTNNMRSNYPFGNSKDLPNTWVSTNGCKRGISEDPAYNGFVFEPIDAYKGDFARSYFYMLTRYSDQVDDWNSEMLEGNGFTDWAENTLLTWHEMDPVSEKEINRNNAVYGIQNNRNPFIDHPEFAATIWGTIDAIHEMEYFDAQAFYQNNTLMISHTADGQIWYQVVDLSGKSLAWGSSNSSTLNQQINLGSGIYILQLVHDNAVVTTRFFVR
jgi:endonuclease I